MSNELSRDDLKWIKNQIKYNKKNYRFKSNKQDMVMKYFQEFNGYTYDFNNPITFNEKINTRKLEKNPLYSLVCNKIKVREYVKNKIGEEYLIPIYFTASKLTGKLYDKMPNQCVLKTASGSSTIKIIWDKEKENKQEILSLMREYQKIEYEYIWGEMFYKTIKNPILCEKLLINESGKVPNDYKIHCFRNGGNPKYFIEVDCDRFGTHTRNIYDENWKLLKLAITVKNSKEKMPKPKKLKELLQVAKKLSEDFDYIRVDLYLLGDKIYFGELTCTHGAGFSPFNPENYNKLWGEYWK